MCNDYTLRLETSFLLTFVPNTLFLDPHYLFPIVFLVFLSLHLSFQIIVFKLWVSPKCVLHVHIQWFLILIFHVAQPEHFSFTPHTNIEKKTGTITQTYIFYNTLVVKIEI